ncbi:MAG: hypothetical protein ACNS62_23395 [Candidatus Cyclobacteriaceae bacterium M3_2C_046]
MKSLLIATFMAFSTCAYSQADQASEINLQVIDSILMNKVQDHRLINQLPDFFESEILNHAAIHHSEYMAKTAIVSHFQKMPLISFNRLYSPKERIAHFANNELGQDNYYGEICFGIRMKNAKSNEAIAEKLFQVILESENEQAVLNPECRYIGLSVQSSKKTYYTTINFALGYNNIIALLSP